MSNKKKDNVTLYSVREKLLAESKIRTVLRTFFDTKNPARESAWNELYCEYLERIKTEHHELFNEILDLEKIMVNDKKMRAVFLLFKKIVPTVAPSDHSPLAFLQDSILDVKRHKDYNKLCIFIQVATQNLKKIEERVIDKGTHNKLLLPRKKYEERAILYPLFETILKKRIGYSKGYKEIIVPTLVKHEKYLIQSIGKCIENMKKKSIFRKNKKVLRKNKSVLIKRKLDEYNKIRYKIMGLYTNLKEYQECNKSESVESTKNELIENIFKIDTLKTNYIRNKFYGWKRAVLREAEENTVNYFNKTCSSIDSSKEKELFVTVSASRLTLPASYVKSVFWSPIFDWPTNDYLLAISTLERNDSAMERSPIDELWTIFRK